MSKTRTPTLLASGLIGGNRLVSSVRVAPFVWRTRPGLGKSVVSMAGG